LTVALNPPATVLPSIVLINMLYHSKAIWSGEIRLQLPHQIYQRYLYISCSLLNLWFFHHKNTFSNEFLSYFWYLYSTLFAVFTFSIKRPYLDWRPVRLKVKKNLKYLYCCSYEICTLEKMATVSCLWHFSSVSSSFKSLKYIKNSGKNYIFNVKITRLVMMEDLRDNKLLLYVFFSSFKRLKHSSVSCVCSGQFSSTSGHIRPDGECMGHFFDSQFIAIASHYRI
jgi:hypothetical protein